MHRTLGAILLTLLALPLFVSLPAQADAATTCSTLARGSSGTAVTTLQKFLAKEYTNFTMVTGFFGLTTEAAVKQWQGEHGITKTGTIGPRTRAAMKLSCTPLDTRSDLTGQASNNSSTKAALIQALLAQIKILQDRIAALKGGGTAVATSTATTTESGIGGNGGAGSGTSPPTYAWRTGGWSTCVSAQQTRTVSCISSQSAIVAESYCAAGKPAASQLCTVGVSPQTCTFNGQTVAHGASVTSHQASSVPAGSQCVSQQRTCHNGTLSGTYQYSTCSVAASTSTPSCTLRFSPSSVRAGEAFTYEWTTTNAESLSGIATRGGSTVFGPGPIGLNGSTSGSWQVPGTYAYTFTVTKADKTASCTANLNVTAASLPYVNAVSYGLSTTKSGSQNTAALQAAVRAAGSGRVVIPAGSYCLSGPVSLTEGGTWLSGAGVGATTLSSCGTNATLVSLTSGGEMLTGLSLIGKQGGSSPVVTLGASCVDCFIESLDISGGSYGIRNESGEIHFYDIALHNPASAAIYSTGNIFMSNIRVDTYTYAPYAIQFDTGALEEHLHNVSVTGPFGHAFALSGGRASFTCSQCSSRGTTGSAAYFASGRGALIIDSAFGPGSESGSSAIEFGSNFEGWSSVLGGSAAGAAYGIYIGGGSDYIVDGVQASGGVKGIGVAAGVSNYKIESTGRYFQPTVRNIDAAQMVAAHAPPSADAVNAADYGLATTGNGAQNAAALSAALAKAGSGGRVIIPKGLYCIGREVNVPAGVWLDGESYRGTALSACGVDTALLNLTGQGTKLTNLMLIGKGANRDVGAFGAREPIVRVAASCTDCFLMHLHFTGGLHSIENAGQHTSFFGIIGYAPFGSSLLYSTGNDTVIYRAKLDHASAGPTPSTRPIEPWKANTAYSTGDLAKLNGFYIIALKGGASGSTPPMLQNNAFSDGSVEWSWQAAIGSSQLEIAGGSAYGTQVDMTGQLEHALSMTNAGGSVPSFSCLDCILSQAFDSQVNLRAGGTLELSNTALGIGVVGTEGVHIAPSWGGRVRIEGGIYGGGGAPAIHFAGGTNHIVNGVVVTSDGAAGVQVDAGTDAFVSAICRGASPCLSQYVPPVVTITANPSTVPSGGRTSISWVATNATSCSYSSPTNSPTDYAYTNSAPTNGETGVGPLTSDATYMVTCGGISKSVTVTVTAPANAPTCEMHFDPPIVGANVNSTLSWSSTNATSLTFPDGWNGIWPVNGSIPGAHSGQTFTVHGLFAGPGGNTTCAATLAIQ